MNDINKSERFQLKSEDYAKIIKGVMIAFAGAMIPLIGELTQMVDFGNYDAIAGAVAATLINAIRKWIVNNQGK